MRSGFLAPQPIFSHDSKPKPALKATLHSQQEPLPWNSRGTSNSSKLSAQNGDFYVELGLNVILMTLGIYVIKKTLPKKSGLLVVD